RWQVEVKFVPFEEIDQSIRHIVAGNEVHIDVEPVLRVTVLLQLQRCSIVDLEIPDVRSRLSHSASVESGAEDDNLAKTIPDSFSQRVIEVPGANLDNIFYRWKLAATSPDA